jgi:prevent-host-death family protein
VTAPDTAAVPAGAPALTHANWLNKLVCMLPGEIGAFEAKTRLSELLDAVAGGRTFVITKRGRPVAELRPVTPAASADFSFGCDGGLVEMADDFDAPVPGFEDLE